MASYYMLGGDGKEYGPVSADQLRQWATEGRANAQTQVRATGTTGYVSFGLVPEFTALPVSAPVALPTVAPTPKFFTRSQSSDDTDTSAQIKRLAATVAAGNAWMKLLALTMFLLAGVLGITVVGLVVAWLPLWQGINLWSAANQAKQAVYTGSEQDLLQSLGKIKRSFVLGFLLIVALVIFYMAVLAIFMMTRGMGALQGLGNPGSF